MASQQCSPSPVCTWPAARQHARAALLQSTAFLLLSSRRLGLLGWRLGSALRTGSKACRAAAATPPRATGRRAACLLRSAACLHTAAGVPFNVVGKTIHSVADKHKFGVVRMFVGHGVGTVFHAYPHILHFRCAAVPCLLWVDHGACTAVHLPTLPASTGAIAGAWPGLGLSCRSRVPALLPLAA
jgi:hypothetical protein